MAVRITLVQLPILRACWTLPFSLTLTKYVQIKENATGRKIYLAKGLLASAFKKPDAEVEVLKTCLGKDLVGISYEPLFDFFKNKKQEGAFKVITSEHVTADSGTGIVHMAPAFGEEDFQMHQKHQLPVLMTVDAEGRFDEEMGAFAGLAINEAHGPVIEALKAADRLFKKESITHSVATCWRCKTRLMFKAQPAWYIDLHQLKDLLCQREWR